MAIAYVEMAGLGESRAGNGKKGMERASQHGGPGLNVSL